MSRRAFLGQCIALAAAPAIVRASSLMPGKVWVGIDLSGIEGSIYRYDCSFGFSLMQRYEPFGRLKRIYANGKLIYEAVLPDSELLHVYKTIRAGAHLQSHF